MGKKFHWLLHLKDALVRFGALPACWTVERKHKLLNRFGRLVENTRQYELSVLRGTLCNQLLRLREPDQFASHLRLDRTSKAPAKARDFLASVLQLPDLDAEQCLSSAGLRLEPAGWCKKGDVALLRCNRPDSYDACEVFMHYQIYGKLYSLVSLWTFVSWDRKQSTAVWLSCPAPLLVASEEILCSVVYTKQGSEVTVIIPFEYR